MHKEPSRRYLTVEALIRDIDHYLRGEPLEARPDSARYRAGKFLRRHWRAVSAATRRFRDDRRARRVLHDTRHRGAQQRASRRRRARSASRASCRSCSRAERARSGPADTLHVRDAHRSRSARGAVARRRARDSGGAPPDARRAVSEARQPPSRRLAARRIARRRGARCSDPTIRMSARAWSHSACCATTRLDCRRPSSSYGMGSRRSCARGRRAIRRS